MIDIGGLCSCNNFFICRLKITKSQIFFNGSLIQPGILKHHPELFAVFLTGNMSDVVAINRNGSSRHIVKAHQQIDKSSFSSSSRTNNGHHFTGFHFQIEIPNQRLVRYILEIHMFEAHLTGQISSQGFTFIFYLIRFIHDLENPIQRRFGTL